MVIRIIVYVIAALLIGAHFLRAADFWVVAICVAAPLVFLYRRRLSLVLLQIFAYAAAGIWMQTAWQLIQVRQAHQQDWKLGAAILGAVALYTLMAGLLLNSSVMRERYGK